MNIPCFSVDSVAIYFFIMTISDLSNRHSSLTLLISLISKWRVRINAGNAIQTY